MKTPIFLALDVDSNKQAVELAKKTAEYVGGFKIGPRLSMKYGEKLVSQLADLAPVFVDNKYYDIPSTMEASVRASFDAGASFCTIHAQSGPEALRRMAAVEAELNDVRPFKILCVTILTSFDQGSLPVTQKTNPIPEQVMALIEQCRSCGLNSFVCSAEEVENIKKRFPDTYLVTPGIRLPEDAADDQKRVMGPKMAIDLGADALVVGRPITKAENPALAAKKFFESL